MLSEDNIEEEIEKLEDLMKPDVEDRMKIQRTPWIEADVMEFDDVYMNVGLSKQLHLENGLLRMYFS